MSRTNRNQPGSRTKGKSPRRITVRSTRRTPPDLHKLSRALLELAAAQAEADAEASAGTKAKAPSPSSDSDDDRQPTGGAS